MSSWPVKAIESLSQKTATTKNFVTRTDLNKTHSLPRKQSYPTKWHLTCLGRMVSEKDAAICWGHLCFGYTWNWGPFTICSFLRCQYCKKTTLTSFCAFCWDGPAMCLRVAELRTFLVSWDTSICHHTQHILFIRGRCHGWMWKSVSGIMSQETVTLFFWNTGASGEAGWPGNPRDLPVSTSPSTHHEQAVHMGSWVKLKSSGLHGKYFTSSPAPGHIFEW